MSRVACSFSHIKLSLHFTRGLLQKVVDELNSGTVPEIIQQADMEK